MKHEPMARVVSRKRFLRAGLSAFLTLAGALASACGRRQARLRARTPTASGAGAAFPAPTNTATLPPPEAPATSTLRPAPTSTLVSPTATATTKAPTFTLSPTATNTAMPPTPTLSPEMAADMVLFNGKVITVDSNDTIAEAVAIKKGLIQAVGSNPSVRALVGPTTEVLDLHGKAVTPGFVDPHNHLQVLGQLQGFYIPLLPPEVKTMDDLRARLREVIARTPAGQWVQGYFLTVDKRLPNRHDLDPISPNHPVFLVQQGGHYGSANSLALKIAGVTAATRDPVGGLIERDGKGEPTGVFYNHRAMDVIRRYTPRLTDTMVHDNIIYGQGIFAASGVTTFHDNNVRGVETVKSYLDAGKRGEMILRGRVYYTLEWPEDLDRALREIPYDQGGPFMHFAGFKFLLDGQALMAYCHEPHNGVRWDMPTWEPQSFKKAVRALHDTGLQICVHCVGDAAVDLTLDAFEEAMNANPRPDPRHRLEHVIYTTPQSTKRIKKLGVVVSTQPQFIRLYQSRARCVELFGEERARRMIVTREWLEAGIPLALGSDAPTTPWLTPQVTLFGAVRRITYSNDQIGPEQSLTVQEALRAHTMGSAYAGHEEKIVGSIEPGKLADLAVWGKDPYTAPAAELWQIPIEMTLVGGKAVYRAKA